MTTLRQGLAAGGYPSMTFDYPYIEAGRGRPDRAAILENSHRAAAARLGEYAARVVLGGKSMGGRIGGHVAAEVGAVGLVFYGYPLVSISGVVRPLDHLMSLDIPKLFFGGTRDRMSPLPRLRRAIAAIPNAEAAMIEGGDHSLKAPRAAGMSHSDVLAGVVQITSDWLESLQEHAEQ
jgi:predicted alpha/beta-hydrolase family hydrolase